MYYRCGGSSKRLELEGGPEAVTEPQSYTIFTDEELLLTDEKRKWLLEMESTPGEYAVKILQIRILHKLSY